VSFAPRFGDQVPVLVGQLLRELGEDPKRTGLAETPDRVARSLRFLTERFGGDHVVLGSDYPFDMGCEAPVAAVRELNLPPATDRAITGGTLARLLNVG